jgi:hypothetical protein
LQKIELVGMMSVLGVVAGVFFYTTQMQRLCRLNYQASDVRSYVWKIGLGYALLTIFMAIIVKG